jgi:hypothetical protein
LTAEDTLRKTADTILKQRFGPGNLPGPKDIESAVERASRTLSRVIPDCGTKDVRDRVIEVLQTNWNVYVEDARILELRENDHKEWLTQSMGLIDPKRQPILWRFWRRYLSYLETERGRPEAVTASLDKATTQVLRRLEDPQRRGTWDRRGMVVGYVQSGKTGNYSGLICKAIDAGYRLVIVLAGLHENLRRQTQVRLDQEIRGRQTRDVLESEQWIGAGRVDSSFTVRSVTTSAIDSKHGDFSKDIAQRRGLLELGSDPSYMVVKKNARILTNITEWLKSLPEYRAGKVRGIPLLVIDDECDLASINTREVDFEKEEQDMTAINKLVRKLLSQFEQSAYVGYTATPFANIFIRPDSRDINVEEDLFPRDFIVSIEPPSNYVGPAELFGLTGEAQIDLDAREGLDLVRDVTDSFNAFPPGHRKELDPKFLPDSLKEAIRCFLLSCAIRWQRGQSAEHNSMLIHVSRFNLVQEKIERLVTKEYESIKNRIEMNDGDPGNDRAPIFEEFRSLWQKAFVPVSPTIPSGYKQPTWRQILPQLKNVATRIQIATVNGLAGQVLNYDTESHPLNVIAIGGDKFSRGFTLEGLSVSYYLRATNMYDTLMQMGRWFGYRDGYLDLCRIYTTPSLQDAYRFIAGAIEELRRDFRRMELENARPLDFGHKVRLSPALALLVTSRDKSRSAFKLRATLDGTLAQTLVFPLDTARHTKNLRTSLEFLSRLRRDYGDPRSAKGVRLWSDVPGSEISRFIGDFDIHGRNSFDVVELLPRFIEGRLAKGELSSWTVAFDTLPKSEGMAFEAAGQKGRTAVREKGAKLDPDRKSVRIKVLTTPQHEMIDLSPEQVAKALQESRDEFEADQHRMEGRRRKSKVPPRIPYPDIIRQQRSSQNGLLVLYFIDPKKSWNIDLPTPAMGFGISFPKTPGPTEGVEYLANIVAVWEAAFD